MALTFIGGSSIFFFNHGMWREKSGAISEANWKAVGNGAYYDCVVSCLGSSTTAKIIKGAPRGGGSELLKKLHAAKGPVGHQDSKVGFKARQIDFGGHEWLDLLSR